MREALEPFALVLYRRFLNGESVEQLAAEFGISAERVDLRIRAAALYYDRQKTESSLFALRSYLD